MDLETTYYIVGVGISTINILLCVTVIFVSFYINSKSNEEYAKVIAVNTIIDFTYSVVNALTVSSSFTSSNYIYKFINGPIFVDCSESTANNVLRVHIFFTSLLGVSEVVLSIFNISEHNAVTEAEVKEFYVDDDTIPPYIAFGFVSFTEFDKFKR
ncbi:unnamed protein product [Bursaphelenchus okinawaensis]|uniref:Uncharacterized protein n=1 Tax=Bursaphelenchus okinawaensis TaxID=465554 RepID=A0A811JRU7_9BILA|nr:unnamed protein product [Bursaphelenchus okinawaensis]CAG9080329.1 unnamed protein product [Bursaphelenchus okinawaensis]